MARRREGWCGCHSANSTLSCRTCCYKWLIKALLQQLWADNCGLAAHYVAWPGCRIRLHWLKQQIPPPRTPTLLQFLFCEWCSVIRLILSFLCGVSIGVATLWSPWKTTRVAFLAQKPLWKCAAEKLQTGLHYVDTAAGCVWHQHLY